MSTAIRLDQVTISAGRVFCAKFAFAVLSALLLFPGLWLLAFAMASWELPDAVWHLQLSLRSGFALIALAMADLQGIPNIRARALRMPPQAQRTLTWTPI